MIKKELELEVREAANMCEDTDVYLHQEVWEKSFTLGALWMFEYLKNNLEAGSCCGCGASPDFEEFEGTNELP